MDTINRVWMGEAGLARTYWLFGVIGSFVWGLLIGGIKPGSILAIVAVVLFFAYIVMVNVGTWRAASQYEGPRAWAILAKMAVAAIPALVVVGTIAAIVIPATNIKKEQTQEQGPWLEHQNKPESPGLVPFNGQLDKPSEQEAKKAPCGDIDAFLEQCKK